MDDDSQKPVEVFSTQDLGEQAFMRSLLHSHGIRTFDANLNVERFALYTSSFFRRFSVHVYPRDVHAAKELIKEHEKKTADKLSSPALTLLARVMLAVVVLTLLTSLLLTLRQ